MIEEKIKILIDLGFVPMVEGEGNTLFRMNDVVMSVSDPNQTPEQLKKEVMSLIKNRDIAERGGQVPVVEEPAPEPEQAQKEEPEAPAEEAAPNPGEEDSNPFTENQETLEPFYICDELKKIETPKFVRLTLDGNRFYVRKMDDGTAKIYASVTTMIRDGFVDDKTALQEWRQEMRMIGRNPEEVSEYDADKGTIMHYLYGLYLTGRDMVLNRSFIVKTVQEGKLKISKKNLDKFFGSIDDLDDMIVRVMKFAKFCSEYKVKPMMIERILSLEDYLVATPIDAMVKMTFKYKEEGYFGAVYQRATGQFKNAFQLEAERRMVKNWYGIDARIMNFSPKSTNSKGYTLKEWSDKNAAMEKADCVFQQGMLNHIRKDKRFKVRKGVLNINKPYNEEDHIVVYDIAEEMSKRFVI